MINEYPDEYYNLNLEINIKNVVEGSVASKLSGFFFMNGIRIAFTALAFGRIGGHNVNVTISKTSSNDIKKSGLDPEIIVQIVQRKIIEGDVTILDKKK
ncbi:MAG: hypothetical protein M3Y25_08745 [Thermoproteota archaeon]|nr:hypothetical protein [Thermoproteota archaeon]